MWESRNGYEGVADVDGWNLVCNVECGIMNFRFVANVDDDEVVGAFVEYYRCDCAENVGEF